MKVCLGHLHSRVEAEAEFYLSIDFKIDGNEDDDSVIGQLLRINSNNEGTSGQVLKCYTQVLVSRNWHMIRAYQIRPISLAHGESSMLDEK